MNIYRVLLPSAVLASVAALVLATEAAAQPAFSTISTVHIEVHYQRGVPDSHAQRVADYLQADYSYLSDKLGIDLRKRVAVRIYDAVGKYLSETQQVKDWRGAIYWRGQIHMQPVGVLLSKGTLEKDLSYEFALAMLSETANKGCPRWLRESFAVYHSGIMVDLTPPIGSRLASFSDLDQDLQTHQSPPQRDGVLYILGLTMRFFLEKYGEQKTFSVFRAFDGMMSLEEVFKKTFNQELNSVERTWANFVNAQTKEFPRRQ